MTQSLSRVVPIEPTDTMVKAARDKIAQAHEHGWAGLDVIEIYRVMLSAAPAPDPVVPTPHQLSRDPETRIEFVAARLGLKTDDLTNMLSAFGLSISPAPDPDTLSEAVERAKTEPSGDCAGLVERLWDRLDDADAFAAASTISALEAERDALKAESARLSEDRDTVLGALETALKLPSQRAINTIREGVRQARARQALENPTKGTT